MEILSDVNMARWLIACLVVGLLLGSFALLARRFAHASPFSNRGKRLNVLEVCVLDNRRKLVLVRDETKEHLILLGVNSETLIETRVANLRYLPKPDPKEETKESTEKIAASSVKDLTPPAVMPSSARPAEPGLRSASVPTAATVQKSTGGEKTGQSGLETTVERLARLNRRMSGA